ncbi:unnamed protein product [Boreogadus saida]
MSHASYNAENREQSAEVCGATVLFCYILQAVLTCLNRRSHLSPGTQTPTRPPYLQLHEGRIARYKRSKPILGRRLNAVRGPAHY